MASLAGFDSPPPSGFAEEARSRLSQVPPVMRQAAAKAIDKGLVDPRRFQIGADAAVSPLESVDNPVGLEAIVLITGRPPMLVQNDRVVIDAIAHNAMGRPDAPLPDLNVGVIQAVEGFLPSIGRVEFVNHRMQWGGTAWVIEGGSGDRSWVVTNRHVAKLVAQRVHDGSGVFLRSPAGALYGARIDMAEEHGVVRAGRDFMVERVRYLADATEPDCALLEIITPAASRPSPLPLAQRRARRDELVAAIGYPAHDDRNEDAPMRKYFGDIFNVKRFAPGYVTQSEPGLLLMHDCTTLGGNSGSPVVSLAERAVVGLHFSGSFGVGNSAVGVETLRQLQTGRLFAVSGSARQGDEAPADRAHEPAHFAGRQGYAADFLGSGMAVPVPEFEPALAADLAAPSDATAEKPYELRYTNFGVWFSTSRRSPLFTAVNIDGAASRRIKRRPRDQWYFDLRIPREVQLGKDHFAGDLDRGHMVRREDPNFGDLAEQANDDTFHYTNAALQHSALNQGSTLWRGLEDHVLDSARTHGFRACVFTGPVLAADDPPLAEDGGVQIPREFWKVVVMPAADGAGLHATAYLLSQGDLIRRLLETRDNAGRGLNEAPAEGFELGPYRTFQIALRHVEQETGLSWPALDGADPLAAAGDEAVSAVTYRPLETMQDAVL